MCQSPYLLGGYLGRVRRQIEHLEAVDDPRRPPDRQSATDQFRNRFAERERPAPGVAPNQREDVIINVQRSPHELRMPCCTT